MNNINQSIENVLKQVNKDFNYSEKINLRDDLDLDSLEVIKFLLELENELNIEIPEEDIDSFDLMNLGNLSSYLTNKLT
jgi:acyl carrier protein